jgi:hypothetical protein
MKKQVEFIEYAKEVRTIINGELSPLIPTPYRGAHGCLKTAYRYGVQWIFPAPELC